MIDTFRSASKLLTTSPFPCGLDQVRSNHKEDHARRDKPDGVRVHRREWKIDHIFTIQGTRNNRRHIGRKEEEPDPAQRKNEALNREIPSSPRPCFSSTKEYHNETDDVSGQQNPRIVILIG